jgi:hypothetical protein
MDDYRTPKPRENGFFVLRGSPFVGALIRTLGYGFHSPVIASLPQGDL